jgi:hypothetical protein
VAGFRETTAGAILACAILLGSPVVASGSTYSADEEIICVGDSCQSLPPEPDDPMPGTLVPNPGNPPLHVFGPKKKHKHRKKHSKRHRDRGKHGTGRPAGGSGR